MLSTPPQPKLGPGWVAPLALVSLLRQDLCALARFLARPEVTSGRVQRGRAPVR